MSERQSLYEALGPKGDLEAWLEVRSENEIRAAILALPNVNSKEPGAEGNRQDEQKDAVPAQPADLDLLNRLDDLIAWLAHGKLGESVQSLTVRDFRTLRAALSTMVPAQPAETPEEVARRVLTDETLPSSGRHISAVKAVRTEFGLTLKEAKGVVDAVAGRGAQPAEPRGFQNMGESYEAAIAKAEGKP